jgi:hypothetical protein
MKKVIVFSVCLFLVSALNACCQPGGDFRGQNARGGGAPPPPPFVKACASLKDGASCSFSDRGGSPVSGTCIKKTNPMGDEELVCYNESFFSQIKSPGAKNRKPPE